MTSDVNAEEFETYPGSFICQHDLTNVTKDETCLRHFVQPSFTDIALTNSVSSVQNTSAFLVGSTDLQKLALSNLKTTLVNSKPSEMFS